MKKMKKVLMILIVAVGFGTLVACGGKEEDNDGGFQIPTNGRFRNLSVTQAEEAGGILINATSNEDESVVYYSILSADSDVPSASETANGTDAIKSGSATRVLFKEIYDLEKEVEYLVNVVIKDNNGSFGNVESSLIKTKLFGISEVGLGIPGDEIKIRSVEDLEKIGTGIDGFDLNSYYQLQNDIDLSDKYGPGKESFIPIGKQGGNNSKFGGSLDGQGFTIKGLYINDTSGTEKWGLISELNIPTPAGEEDYGQPSVVKNINFEDPFVSSNGFRIGTVVGYSKGIIENISVTNGTLIQNGGSDGRIGGITGHIFEQGTIRNVMVDVDIESNGRRVGGIVGATDGSFTDAMITDAYSFGTITGTTVDARQIGGIVGNAVDTIIENVYSTMSIEGERQIGGIVGDIENKSRSNGTVTNAMYLGSKLVAKGESVNTAAFGSIVGNHHSTFDVVVVKNVYSIDVVEFDGDSSHSNKIDGQLIDITDVALEDFYINNFSNWDINNKWTIENGLPVLNIFATSNVLEVRV